MWQKIKDNWSQITVLGGILIVVSGAYLDWRIGAKIDTAFVNAGYASPTEVAKNAEDIDDIEVFQVRLETKIDRIIDILLAE